MDKPRQYKAQVELKNKVSSKVTKLKLKVVSPDTIKFIPGQFVNLDCGENKYRSYSIASTNKDINHVTILVETSHEGLGSNFVNHLKQGDFVNFIGPSGKLRLYSPLPMDMVFFATGTGLAPFLSMFHELVEQKYKGRVRLLVGFRKEIDSLELAQLDYFKSTLPDFDYTVYYSQPKESTDYLKETTHMPKIKTGHITEAVADFVNDNAHYYICGHPAMVEEVSGLLKDNGINEDHIIIEGFTRKIKG